MSTDKGIEVLLEAGGLVAPGIAVPDSDVPCDPIEARAYRHAGLGEPVIRLSQTPLGAAIDAEMAVLGFDPGTSLGQVGTSKRRGLGFPAAAIMADPDNAKYALEVVAEFAKAARRAQSKPGHAKTAIDEIGERLGRSVPHFLPSFYEEASRAFLEQGNVKYAGIYFEKAREAERVHALDVDEAMRENTFVEFALAGALSVKSLTNYARELAESADAADAYATFRRVCVRRTLGGLPPWAKMGAELKRLIKAAELDQVAEETALLSEIIDAPALEKAQGGFWKSYQKTLKKMCAAEPATRGRLLNIMPAIDVSEWLALLDECGALEGVTSVDAAPETRPASGAGAWLTKICGRCGGWRSEVPEALFELLERAAPVLAAEGKPVNLAVSWGDYDLDLLELALSLGLELADPAEHADMSRLDSWAARADKSDHFGRDPVRVAADPRYAKLLAEAISGEIGDEPFTSMAMKMQGFQAAIRDWLDERVSRLDGAVGLPDLYDIVETLGRGGLVPVWRAFDEQRERLGEASVAAALAFTLRAGIYDEYSWPAFDEALSQMAPKADIKLGGAFPHLVVSDGVKAIVVGPTSIVETFDLSLPKGADLEGFRYVQGQLLVIFEPEDTWRSHGYWSSDPSETFELEGSFYSYGVPDDMGVVLDDGSVVFGERTMTAGDRKVASAMVACDGESFWAREYDGYRELDPRTSKRGRKSAPAFIAEYARDGSEINWMASRLYPLPPEITDSPLGQRGQLFGRRIRHRNEESPMAASVPMTEAERIDGKTWSHATEHEVPDALITFPGDDRLRPIEAGYGARIIAPGDDQYVAGSANHPQYRRGTRALPPITCWHFMVPRDVAGSTALRQITDEQAAALLEAGAADLEATGGKIGDGGLLELELEGSSLAAAIAETLPAMTSPELITGVAHLALMAARDQAKLARIAALEAGDGDDAAPAGVSDPKGFRDATSGFTWLSEDHGNIAELVWLSELFAGGLDEGEKKILPSSPRGDLDVLQLCDVVGTLAFRAILASTPDDQRNALVTLLEAMAPSFLLANIDKVRLVELEGKIERVSPGEEAFFFEERGNLYVGWNSWDDYYKLVEYAPGGEFKQPLGTYEGDLDETRLGKGWRDMDAVTALLERLSENGPVDLFDLVDRLAPTGLSTPEATAVLSGFALDAAELAKKTGLKKNQAEQALAGVRLGDPAVSSLFGAAIGADPGAPWSSPETFVDNLAAAWIDQLGVFAPLDPEILEAMAKELKAVHNLPSVLRTVGTPSRGPLANDPIYTLDRETGRLQTDHRDDTFSEGLLEELLPVIGYLFFYVPVGDPIRSQLPAAIAAIRARLEAPGLYLSMPDIDFDDDKKRQAFLDDFGGDPIEGADKGRERDGIRLVPDQYDAVEVWVRVSALRDQPAEIERLIALMGWRPDWKRGVDALINGVLDRFAARVADTPVPDGGFECNPIASVPELVAEVGNDLDLDQNAAALYLQLAALPAPRDKQVREWNGWSPKVHKTAATRLLERELIVEAKRARAGRKHFVPGGWEALKNPLLPVETWKLGLYGIESKDGSISAWNLPFAQIAPNVPAHEVFAEAYKRIKAGDGPGYEEPGK